MVEPRFFTERANHCPGVTRVVYGSTRHESGMIFECWRWHPEVGETIWVTVGTLGTLLKRILVGREAADRRRRIKTTTLPVLCSIKRTSTLQPLPPLPPRNSSLSYIVLYGAVQVPQLAGQVCTVPSSSSCTGHKKCNLHVRYSSATRDTMIL